MDRIRPTPDLMECVRNAALVALHDHGFATLAELRDLATRPYDAVMDRMFRHCAVLRLRDTDRMILVTPNNREAFRHAALYA